MLLKQREALNIVKATRYILYIVHLSSDNYTVVRNICNAHQFLTSTSEKWLRAYSYLYLLLKKCSLFLLLRLICNIQLYIFNENKLQLQSILVETLKTDNSYSFQQIKSIKTKQRTKTPPSQKKTHQDLTPPGKTQTITFLCHVLIMLLKMTIVNRFVIQPKLE